MQPIDVTHNLIIDVVYVTLYSAMLHSAHAIFHFSND